MRGKESLPYATDGVVRITPAYAGKSGCFVIVNLSSQDHPCVCGEKLADALGTTPSEGSPLRMRGKATLIIKNSATHKDHPCVCGEKFPAK